MAVRKILITIDTEDDVDIDEYVEALDRACVDVEGRAVISGDCDITIQEISNG